MKSKTEVKLDRALQQRDVLAGLAASATAGCDARRAPLPPTVVLGEAHLCRILRAYAGYYNHFRTHLSLVKDSPGHRPVQWLGQLAVQPILGGLRQGHPQSYASGKLLSPPSIT
jgi:hypothetical protein